MQAHIDPPLPDSSIQRSGTILGSQAGDDAVGFPFDLLGIDLFERFPRLGDDLEELGALLFELGRSHLRWLVLVAHASFLQSDIVGTAVSSIDQAVIKLRGEDCMSSNDPSPASKYALAASQEWRAQAAPVLTTEHFTMQGARSATIADASGRANLFLGSVSLALVALALVGQASAMGTPFSFSAWCSSRRSSFSAWRPLSA